MTEKQVYDSYTLDELRARNWDNVVEYALEDHKPDTDHIFEVLTSPDRKHPYLAWCQNGC